MKMPNELRQLLTRPMTASEVANLWEWFDGNPDIASDCIKLLLDSHPSESMDDEWGKGA